MHKQQLSENRTIDINNKNVKLNYILILSSKGSKNLMLRLLPKTVNAQKLFFLSSKIPGVMPHVLEKNKQTPKNPQSWIKSMFFFHIKFIYSIMCPVYKLQQRTMQNFTHERKKVKISHGYKLCTKFLVRIITAVNKWCFWCSKPVLNRTGTQH